ncbi:Ankrd55 [Symbiodinium pilosum]|uniref:Ankrd55 protein n=1 Tax=Symbiodinium pilosum TaxID=2952 RepID=A0A812NDR3_SYMPI|nr:Ankrd55 [Symbiodinium pilosum]
MLHWAAQRNEAALARHLLSLGADPDAKESMHHRTALDVAERQGNREVAAVLRPATRSRNLDQLNFPQTARASLPAAVGGAVEAAAVPAQRRRSDAGLRRKSMRRRSSLMPEAYLPVLEQIDELGWENMQWTRGFTLLHWAAQNDQPMLVQQLFAKGADPLQTDDDGRTALDYARESGSRAVVEALKLYRPLEEEESDDLDRE